MTRTWLSHLSPAHRPCPAGGRLGRGNTMNTPIRRDDRRTSRAWPQGHRPFPALREAWSAPALIFGLAAALLPAAVLLAPSPAAAHNLSGDPHSHVYVQLSPSTITEGQTTTVGFSVSGDRTLDRYGTGSTHSRHNTAHMDVTKTAATPTATGAGAVTLSSNTRFSWTNYLNGRPNAGTFDQSTASGTVTITTADDSVMTGSRTVTVGLTFSCSPGETDYWYNYTDHCPIIHNATLTIEDNETIPISLALGAPTIAESGAGNSTTVQATLGSAPTATVLVAVSPTSSTDFTWTGGTTLTIASGATTSTNMLTITAIDDATGGNKTVTLTGTNPSATYSDGTATLTIVDDDARIVLSESDLTVREAETGTYTVRLSIQPTGNVQVRVDRGAADYVLNQEGGTQAVRQDLTFTTSTWNTGQVITVIALTDNDAIGSSANISHYTINGATADDYDDAAKTLPLTIMDDDAEIVVNRGTGPLAITEPNAATYTVTLGGTPGGTVVVGVTSDDAGAVTVAPASLTFGTFNWSTGQVVTVTAVDDADGTNETVTVTHAVNDASSSDEFDSAADVTFTVTVTDDEFGLVVGSVTGQATEAGGTATFPVTLLSAPAAAVTVAVASQDTTEGTAAPAALTFSPTTWNTAQTVIVTGADDAADDGETTWNVRLTTTSTTGDRYHNLQEDVAVTTTDNDGPPGVTVMLNPAAVSESAGVATVTARLAYPSGAATTLTVTAVSGFFTVGAGAAGTVLIAAGETTSTDTALVTAVGNTTDEPNRTATVTGTAANALATADSTTMMVTGATLTLTDDDAAPGVTLSLAPASIAEPGGVSTVSATLSHPSSEPSTVTVTAVSGAYTAGTDATIVIAAGATTAAADTATIRVVNDDLYHGSGGRSATVTGSLTNSQGAGAVTGAALTITDDENLPTASLLLSPLSGSISENGGVVTITAQQAGLSGKSSEATTLTVAVTPLASSGAVAGDFTQTGTTLTIAAGSLTSTGLVTVTGVDNNVDAADKLLQISATAAGGNGIQNPGLTALTLTNDDDATASLVLTPAAISEEAGISTVTAQLSHPTTAAAMLTVSTTAVAPAVAGDFTQSGTSLTIAAGATTSTGLVTVLAVGNSATTGNKQVTVSATAAGGRGVANPDAKTLIIRDDEFGLSESAVSGQATEAGGQATFTVRLNTQPMAAVAVAVTSQDTGEGTVSPSTMTFSAGTWNTEQTVTVTGVDDNVDDGTVTWQVRLDTSSSGDSDYNALNDVDVDVTTTDNDDAPTVTLALNPSSVAEMGGVATVTATLSHASGAETALTVTAVSGFFTAGSGAAGVVVIPAEQTTSTDVATVTAVDNTTDEPDRTATVTATVGNARAAADGTTMTVTGATLTLTDDDDAPGVVLSVNPASVAENGGMATVTATLAHPSSDPSTVTVTAVPGAYTVGSDATIIIAAGSTTAASDTAAVAGVDDDVHQGSAGRSVTVTGRLTNTQGAGMVTGAALTLTDDETLPVVMLALGPTSVSENGGVSMVTATLTGPSSMAVMVTVAAAPVASTGAVAGDFTLSPAPTLTIAAGETTSTGTVTVTGVDNDVDVGTGTKSVTVTGTAAGGNGVAAPSAATLTITDDDATTATLVLTPSAILENGGVSTVTARLSHRTTQATTLTVSATEGANTVAGNFTLSPAPTLIIGATATTSAGLVTVSAVDDSDATGTKSVTVSATATGGNSVADPGAKTLIIRDDELGLSESAVSGQATEAGGQATFTVRLNTQPMAAVAVAVTSQDTGEGTVSPPTMTFSAGTWNTAQTVTVTGVDDNVDDGPVTWQVRLATSSSGDSAYNALNDVDVDVTTTDDDDAPGVTLALNPASITESGAGSTATVTATLAYPSGAATTVTVTATPVAPAAAADITLSPPATLIVAAGATVSTGTVTVTANDNAVDADDKTVTVAGTAANARATADGMTISVTAATLTLTDDDERGFVFNPADLVVAAGSTAAYTVALTSQPTAGATVTVTLTPDAAVTVEPESLTFTATTWTTAQPVTLTVAAGTTAPASLVEHRVTGGAYETEMKALPVTRMAVPRIGTGEPIETRAAAGEHHVLRDNQLVTVTQAAGVPAGMAFTPAARLTRPLTVAVRPLSEAEAAAAAGSGYRLGLPAERAALDVTVTPPQSGRLCLPVSDELLARAASRTLVLLRAGEPVDPEGSMRESWVDAAGRTRVRICANVPSSFSPFAVGFEDRPVAFSAAAQARSWDFTFETGRKRSYELPAVETGDGVTYRVEEEDDLPDGLAHVRPEEAAHGGTITGTARAPMAKQPYMLIATDAYNQEAELPFTIEVQPGIERRDLALVLAGIGRTLASDAVEILGSRSGPPPSRLHVTLGGQVLRLTAPAGSAPAPAAPSAAGAPSPLASAPSPLAGEGRGEGAAAVAPAATPGPSPWQRVTGVAVGVARALGVTLDTPALPAAGGAQSEDSTFPSAQTILSRAPADPRRPASPTWRSPLSLQPVSAKDLLARSAFELPLTRTDADGLPTWTVWGRGAASGFSGQPEEGFKMDGTLYSGYLGLDYRQASLLMGLAVAHSTGTVDYERTGGTTAGVDVQLTSLLPYAHWQPYAGLGLWGLLGAGWGEMDLKAVGDPTTYSTALTSWLGAVGGRQALTTWQGIDLAAKTDAFLTTLRSEAKTNLPGARGHAERVRLLLEGQTAVALSPVSRVQPRLEVGGRWDSGTAEQGLGLELGGGLAYTQTEWGLSVDMQGRYLLVHEDGAFEDWGASVNVRLDPGVGGEGAYLTVAPVWGQPGSGVEQLWGQAAAVPGGPPAARAAGWRPGNVEIDVGYGLALADGRGLLTPYGGLVLGDPGTARYRLGSRWALSTLLDLNIEGERAEQPGQAAAHGVSVRLGWQW